MRDLPKGTVLDMGGHHHTIDGVEGVLNPAAAIGTDAALPFYLLSHRTLCRDVPAGKLITLGDREITGGYPPSGEAAKVPPPSPKTDGIARQQSDDRRSPLPFLKNRWDRPLPG